MVGLNTIKSIVQQKRVTRADVIGKQWSKSALLSDTFSEWRQNGTHRFDASFVLSIHPLFHIEPIVEHTHGFLKSIAFYEIKTIALKSCFKCSFRFG